MLLPQKLNAYSYCANLPLTSIDPTGMENEDDICSSVEFAGKCVDGPSDAQSIPIADPTYSPQSSQNPQDMNNQEFENWLSSSQPKYDSQRAQEAADWATENAEDSYTHNCAKYVGNALNFNNSPGGLNPDIPVPRGNARDWGNNLTTVGFEDVAHNACVEPQKGDVIVMSSQGGLQHVAIFNGSDWVSDKVQDTHENDPNRLNGALPGPSYENALKNGTLNVDVYRAP